MNIAWCHNAVTGGAKRAGQEFVRELSRRGHVIDEFIVADEPIDDYLPLQPFVRATYRTALGKPPVPPDLRPYLLETTAAFAYQWFRARMTERALRQTADRINHGDYDLVNIDQHPFCWVAGLLPYLRRPAVVYSHEVSMQRYLTEPVQPTGAGLRGVYARWCQAPIAMARQAKERREANRIRLAPLVLTNSRYSVDLWAQRGHDAKLCYYGVDHQLFRPLGLPVEPMVLSVGRLVPAKGHDLVIESIAALPPEQRPRVVVATPETTAVYVRLVDDLRRLACERQVELQIMFAPEQDELVRLYNQALAMIFVPQMEPFGLVAIEAMACGTPVIGVREGGLPESVVDGVTGLLVERDASQIAAAVQTLRAQPELRERLGRQAREHIERSWTWERAVDRYEQMVREFLGRGASGSVARPRSEEAPASESAAFKKEQNEAGTAR